MPAVTSFQSLAVPSQRINEVVAECLALERARMYRRLFLTRFGALAVVVAVVGWGFNWLSSVASCVSVGFCAIAPAWGWVHELKCARRLARSLDECPSSHPAVPVVRKS